jgi:hypothetical protein
LIIVRTSLVFLCREEPPRLQEVMLIAVLTGYEITVVAIDARGSGLLNVF